MSIVLMSAAFKAQIKATPKLVLLALCDCANDQGECYPSVPTLMEKCSAGERTVQDAIGFLSREGYLSREFRTGRSTVYQITDPRKWRTPANGAPPQMAPPAAAAPTPAVPAPLPPQQPHPTPAAAAPITVKEPSVEPSRKKRAQPAAPDCVASEVLTAAGFDGDTAAEFIAHKSRMKAPLTARAWTDHLREAAKAGWSPMAAAEKVMAKSWRGFEASYVAKEPKPGTQAGHPEPAWRTEQRARNEAFLGPAAAKRTTKPPEHIDAEPPRLVG